MQASRYDTQADWFVEHTRDWKPTSAPFLPVDLAEQHVLDLASGWGQLSRELAARGASATAVELAPALVQRARAREAGSPLGIRYLQGDVGTLDWWDGQAFDGVVCNMALMDIDDLDAALHTAYAVLRPGGWFNFSLLHPCFPGRAQTDTLPSWPPDKGYATEGWWTTNSTGVRGHVGANHRMLSTYLNAALRAGFRFTAFAEADPNLPCILFVECRKS
jgi:ubiquinone/menaquinone biosynthesis C-methylase UbiE